jgi:hypothetical protein
MAEKRKAGGAAKKAVAAEQQKAQSARFIEAARDAGFDESGKGFESAINKIAKTAKSPSR